MYFYEDNFNNLMFSKPQNGWSNFNIIKYCPTISPYRASYFRTSYISTNVVSIFKMFINMLNSKENNPYGLVPFDAEGYHWYLANMGNEFNVFINTEVFWHISQPITEMSAITTTVGFEMHSDNLQIAKDWIECYEAFPEDWLAFELCEMSGNSLKENTIRENYFRFNLTEEEIQEKLKDIQNKRDELNSLCSQLKEFIKENSNK